MYPRARMTFPIVVLFAGSCLAPQNGGVTEVNSWVALPLEGRLADMMVRHHALKDVATGKIASLRPRDGRNLIRLLNI